MRTPTDADGLAAPDLQPGERGDPPKSCPYPSTSTLRTAWIRGYAETRPVSAQPERAD
ncbi:Rmf/CrpP fold protein [Streptomyces albicerus]|uniref:Rmf/CrpP fold protein n=1 Tax=Streptomyces albicerus TaxID=2569859 RepID=UPI00298D6CE0|nr:Rmf/CrpP fold protein [Streptomyces albicerus]